MVVTDLILQRMLHVWILTKRDSLRYTSIKIKFNILIIEIVHVCDMKETLRVT